MLAAEHQHLLEPPLRQVICVCDACAVLFSSVGQTRYRRVPRRILCLTDFRLTDAQWESLRIPIDLAFFIKSSSAERFGAFYPSPAGPTESLLDLGAWRGIAEHNPVLHTLEADVEALLVNRIQGSHNHFVVPIDECFKLVGLIRTQWRGFTGGQQAWNEIGRFFDSLQRRSTPRGEQSSA